MKRVLIGIGLAVLGLIGLVLTACGGIAVVAFRDADSQQMRSVAADGWPMLLIGLAILGGLVWWVIRWFWRTSHDG